MIKKSYYKGGSPHKNWAAPIPDTILDEWQIPNMILLLLSWNCHHCQHKIFQEATANKSEMNC